MPKEIDCPDCKWRHTHSSLNPVNQHELVLCGNCNNGKITVYTEEEFQEAIGEYANTKLYQEGYRSGVLAERERCALICENISTDKAQEFVAGLKLAEAIRAK